MIMNAKDLSVFVLSALMVIFLYLPALAQDAPPSFEIEGLIPNQSPKTQEKVVERTYSQVTYDGLYKLAWSYGAFDLENLEHLNTYLKITECNLYMKFYQKKLFADVFTSTAGQIPNAQPRLVSVRR